MPYSHFSLSRVKREFNLTTVENERFIPEIQPIEPSFYLKEALSESCHAPPEFWEYIYKTL